jgi:hypothetical protein
MRRLSLDTVEVLPEHQAACKKTFALAGDSLDPSSFVFSAAPDRSRLRCRGCRRGLDLTLPTTLSAQVRRYSRPTATFRRVMDQ